MILNAVCFVSGCEGTGKILIENSRISEMVNLTSVGICLVDKMY